MQPTSQSVPAERVFLVLGRVAIPGTTIILPTEVKTLHNKFLRVIVKLRNLYQVDFLFYCDKADGQIPRIL